MSSWLVEKMVVAQASGPGGQPSGEGPVFSSAYGDVAVASWTAMSVELTPAEDESVDDGVELAGWSRRRARRRGLI